MDTTEVEVCFKHTLPSHGVLIDHFNLSRFLSLLHGMSNFDNVVHSFIR